MKIGYEYNAYKARLFYDQRNGSRGQGNASAAQKYVWSAYGSGKTYNPAKTYQNNLNNAKITMDKTKIDATFDVIGPITMTTNGEIEKITVKDIDGKEISKDKLRVVTKDSKTGEYKDIAIKTNTTTKKTHYDIVKKTTFYILNNSEQEVKEISFEGGGEVTFYWAKVTLYDKGTCGKCRSTMQRIMHIDKASYYKGLLNASSKITVNVKKGSLAINKTDSYSGKGVEGVQFKLYCQDLKKYVKTADTGINIYTENIDDATIFTTDKNGKLTINGLYIFENGKYDIIEVGSENPYYNDPIILKSISKDRGTLTELEDGTYKIENVPIVNSTKATDITITNKRTSGDIKISKTDSLKKEGLVGTKVKIRLDESIEYPELKDMWLKGNGDFSKINHAEYLTSNESEASEFESDENGEINIKGIITGTYHVYETEGSTGYDIEGQKNYDPEKNWVDLGIFEVTEETEVATTNIENDITRGNIELEKQDSIYEELKLEGAEFKFYLEPGTSPIVDAEGWLENVDKNEYLERDYLEFLTENEKESGTFKTDENGLININGIPNGTYHVYETKTPVGYNILVQDGYDEEKQWLDLGTIKVNSLAVDGTGGKTTLKYNATQEKTEVIVQNKKIIDHSITTTTPPSTPSTPPPSGGELGELGGVTGYVWVDGIPASKDSLSEASYNSVYGSDDKLLAGIKVTLYTKDGAVIADTVTDSNGRYSIKKWNATSDKKLHVDPTRDDIYYWDLVNAYLTFEYDNTKYMCSNPFKNGGKSILINSKAQEEKMTQEELNDSNLTGAIGTVKGVATTLKNGEGTKTLKEIIETTYKTEDTEKELSTYGLTAYYNVDTFNVENINLGLWNKYEPSYAVEEQIQYSKIIMKGYTYTYDYANGENGQITAENRPELSTHLQKGSRTYGASVYPSDIAYTASNTDGMQMYVVYKINVINNTTVHYPDVYDEYELYLDSLTNVYDSERFELCTEHQNDANYRGSEYFGLWSDADKATANSWEKTLKYNLNDSGLIASGDRLSEGIKPGTTKSVYLQFKVKQDFLNKVVTGDPGIEKQMTRVASKAITDGYHIYYRDDNLWNGGETKYKSNTGIPATDNEINSLSGKYTHRSLNQQQEAGKLSLLVELGETRSISGTVFEDAKLNQTEERKDALGNGFIDTTEANRVQGVKVELIDAEKCEKIESETNLGSIKPTTIYIKEGNTYVAKDAITETDVNGNYTIDGIVPGLYFLRFTYPNGQTKIVKNGVKVADVTTNDYKSTIINTQEAGKYLQNAMQSSLTDMRDLLNKTKVAQTNMTTDENAQDYAEWYKKLDRATYNIATDDIKRRDSLGGKTYSENNDKLRTNVDDQENYTFGEVWSYTPYFSITVENTETPSATVELKKDADGYSHQYEYKGFNLGLIQVPETSIQVEKMITNVKLVDTTGVVLSQGNPTESTAYVTALDNLTGGSKYTRVEMEQDSIYGSEIQTTYKLTLTNVSEQDYIESAGNSKYGYYFKYGDKENATLKQITIEELLDLLDNDYDLLNQNLDQEITRPAESREAIKSETKRGLIEAVVDGPDEWSEDQYLSLTNWLPFESGAEINTTYIASGRLEERLDLVYQNDAKILSFKMDSGSTLKSGYNWEKYAETNLIVTPDTGENRQLIYTIVGTIGLLIVAVGIVVIIKKVV